MKFFAQNEFSFNTELCHQHYRKCSLWELRDHEENCFAFAAQCTEFPDDPIVKFNNIQNQFEAPLTVYESILKPLRDGNKCQQHITCSYA